MKKVRKIYFLVIAALCYFGVITSVSATATCDYGIKNSSGRWINYFQIKINGYDDYEMGYFSGLYDRDVGLTKCNSATQNCNISAKEYPVDYYAYFTDSGYSSIFDSWFGDGKLTALMTYSINLYATPKSYEIIGEYDICPKQVEVCLYEESNTTGKVWFTKKPEKIYSYWIFKDSMTSYNKEAKDAGKFAFWDDSTIDCQVLNSVDCTEEECKAIESVDYGECSTYNDYMYVLANLKSKNGGSCSESDEFTEAYRELVDLCEKYSSSTNYTNEQGDTVKGCMKACSNLKDDIAELCDYKNSQSSTKQCNSIGDRTLAWIFKIINMIRYLVPILLIILGILDFIKSIASDDDGEIKKAGSRFVRRLIAAALVFIVPLILQFVLNIFSIPGLDPNNPFCVLFINF